MTHEDRTPFAEAMHAMGEAFNEPVSAVRAEAYFDALSDLPLADVNRAVRLALRNSRFFPRPVELREMVEGNAGDNAEVAWASVLREVRRVGYWGSPDLTSRESLAVRQMWGSWGHLCETLPGEGPELLGWAKQFKAAFQATERVDANQKLLSDETMAPAVREFVASERKRLDSSPAPSAKGLRAGSSSTGSR